MPTQKTHYSDFLLSGFRASHLRTPPAHARSSSLDMSELGSFGAKLRRMSGQFSPGHSKQRSVSTIGFPLSSSSPGPLPEHTKRETPRHRKRNSLLEFPSKLFEKMRDASSSEAPPFEKLANTKKKLRLRQSTPSPDSSGWEAEVWITEGGPYTNSRCSSIRICEEQSNAPSDPFNSSRDSKSVFIDLSDSPIPSIYSHRSRSPSHRSRGSKRDSFLSFSSSTSGRLDVLNPASTHPGRSLRPISVHSNVPSSRPASYPFHRVSMTKYDIEAGLGPGQGFAPPQDGDDALPAPTPISENRGLELIDPTYIDWRQFHIQLLDDE
ncbi:hypothetical protein K435DRAFT_876286 [Dendrothele bispora CBS 962.96]|uniref:Uncharacterized protein n=1 Tax=Dendrothele bispora (strain CBS 962.96) TaxID=1314807 RepID=A0A4V4HBC8_DENBC|nr:hypothetical protein K435DRAFT_876286 [Dendrothele bispora CBS 962.96]